MPDYTWITDDIFIVDQLLSPDECGAYIELSESLGFTEAPINGTFGPQRRPDIRNNRRVMLDDAVRAQDLWVRINPYVPLRRSEFTAIGAIGRYLLRPREWTKPPQLIASVACMARTEFQRCSNELTS